MTTEKRLIDANALIAILEKIADEDETKYFHLDEITQEIFDVPTVDAVEIPDCKKCAFNYTLAWNQCETCLGEARNNFVAITEVQQNGKKVD